MYIFDLDGTLIDSTGVWHQIDLDFLAKYQVAWSPAYDEGVAHTIFPLAAVFTKEYGNLSQSPEEIMAEWMEMAHHAYACQIPLKPFVREFLEQCKKESIPMAVYTSCEPELAQLVLKNNGIEGYFQQIIYARELDCEKHDPASYTAVLKRLGVTAQEVIFFDDSPVNCAGAFRAGWDTVGVYDALVSGPWEEFSRGDYRCIRTFEELLAEDRN